jgi:hypothetical protein
MRVPKPSLGSAGPSAIQEGSTSAMAARPFAIASRAAPGDGGIEGDVYPRRGVDSEWQLWLKDAYSTCVERR